MGKRKRLAVAVAVVVVVLAALRVSLPGLGAFLVSSDEPQRSDIMVVLMGSGPDRMLGAVDFYRAGYHSKRAKRVFVKALGSMDREVRVRSCPTPYDDFNADRWWQDREDLKRGVLEYLKLASFYAWDRFAL